jgi:hypothetical protein
VLAAVYQEKTWKLCDLSWSGWHGCYVVFHVKPLDLASFEPLLIIDRMMWYNPDY